MAQTEFGVNDPLARKAWSKKLAAETIAKTYVGKFIGGDDALIHEKTDLKKSAGDTITCGLRVQLQGDGVQGDNTLEGNEEAIDFHSDSIVIDQLRHATRSKGNMSEKRVPYSMRKVQKDALSDWHAERLDASAFNQMCGYTVQTDVRFTGMNAVSAPTSARRIFVGSTKTDEGQGSGDIFTLEMIDYAREKAMTASIEDGTGPIIRPFKYQGEELYVAFLHPFQVTALRTGSGSRWKEIQDALLQGGDGKKNPLFTGAVGMYNKTIIHETRRITPGVHSSTGAAVSTTRRAVFCGAQAAAIASGGSDDGTKYSWTEEMFDYGNQLGVSAGKIYGLKKCVFQPDSGSGGEDFGVIVMSSRAEAAS